MELSHSTLGGNLITKAHPTWSFEAPQDDNSSPTSPVNAACATLTIGQETTATAPPASPMISLVNLQEQFDSSLAAGIIVATVADNQAARRLKKVAAILSGKIHVLRIYLPLCDLPLAWLDSLFYHCRAQSHSPVNEIHLCIRSLLRPVLQDINDDAQLSRAISTMVQNWTSINVPIKFSFHHLDATIKGRDRLQNFHEKDLVTAMAALPEHGVELTDILGNESRAVAQPKIQLLVEPEQDDDYL